VVVGGGVAVLSAAYELLESGYKDSAEEKAQRPLALPE
jgi:uncharacterized protein with NAD-binding domain and iron-sulfur cluster